jgi:DGQHR domain-containing protein
MAKQQRPVRIVGPLVEGESYAATFTPEAASELFFVSTYDTKDPHSNAHDKHGYQRPPDPKRFPKIAKYYKTNDNISKITPLILSVRLKEPRDVINFVELMKAGDVEGIKELGDAVISVVDGQHRFRGLEHAWKEDADFSPDIPVTLYFGLSFVDEAQLFDDINVNAKKLPKALIEITKGEISETGERTYQQQIRVVAIDLCRDHDSVWGPRLNDEGVREDQVNMTGVRDPNRKVTYEGIRRSTANMYPKRLLGRINRLGPDKLTELAKLYWEEVALICDTAWNATPKIEKDEDGNDVEVKVDYRLKDLVGVASLAKLGKDVIEEYVNSGLNEQVLKDRVKKLEVVNWEKGDQANKWMKGQAGFAGQKELYERLYRWVYGDIGPDDDDL